MPVNPALGKRGGRPETAILPRSHGGAASVTTTPRDAGQVARLQHYLATKAQQQAAQRIRQEAAKWGIQVTGRLSDPTLLFQLNQRAAFAARSIYRTAQKQVATVKANGGSLAALKERRDNYKPAQIFTTEVNTADQMAMRSFYEHNPQLAVTGHVEPTDAEEELCQAEIDKGSAPLDQFPLFPLHVGCPHSLEPDAPPNDAPIAASGAGATVSTATADFLNAAGFWVGGMAIRAARGDLQTQGVAQTGAA